MRLSFPTLLSGAVVVLCCGADAFVLRNTWTGLDLETGQFHRGYFEQIEGKVGIAMDTAVRPPMLPTFTLTESGQLAVPPGMLAIMQIHPGIEIELPPVAGRAPYVVFGSASDLRDGSGGAALRNPRSLAIEHGKLVLKPWQSPRPWAEDAARLTSVAETCGARTAPTHMAAGNDSLQINFGNCSLIEPLPDGIGSMSAAILAGPHWRIVQRVPAWQQQRWVVWQILLTIFAKVIAALWALGAISALALSGSLALAALFTPELAALTWPLTLVIAAIAAALRAGYLVYRWMPVGSWTRPLLISAAATILLGGWWWMLGQHSSSPPRPPIQRELESPCVILGYSTVKGEGLRQGRSGIRQLLPQHCAGCRGHAVAYYAGGETLAWARDTYCREPGGATHDGRVVFLSGANDDLLWGVMSVARLFLVARLGEQAWQRNLAAAMAASRQRLDQQAGALEGLLDCVHQRRARLLYLHDFLAIDLENGRDTDRAAMLQRRRSVTESRGDQFVDLLDAFAAEAGVFWFNDYVHLSEIGHARVSQLACRELDHAE